MSETLNPPLPFRGAKCNWGLNGKHARRARGHKGLKWEDGEPSWQADTPTPNLAMALF